jgi:hypothetical protein
MTLHNFTTKIARKLIRVKSLIDLFDYSEEISFNLLIYKIEQLRNQGNYDGIGIEYIKHEEPWIYYYKDRFETDEEYQKRLNLESV